MLKYSLIIDDVIIKNKKLYLEKLVQYHPTFGHVKYSEFLRMKIGR